MNEPVIISEQDFRLPVPKPISSGFDVEPVTMVMIFDGEKFVPLGTPVLKVKQLSDSDPNPLPSYGSDQAAGLDLYSTINFRIPSQAGAMIPTGIAVEIPFGHYGRVAPRSGLSTKGIDVLGGVIDRDFRGEVKVLLFNHGPAYYDIMLGDRIAQLILEVCSRAIVEKVPELLATKRGADGFGSTGS